MQFISKRTGMRVKERSEELIHSQKRSHDTMSDETRKLLRDFFMPYDKELKSILDQSGIAMKDEDDDFWEGEEEELGRRWDIESPELQDHNSRIGQKQTLREFLTVNSKGGNFMDL
eukprot:gnl/MRDRNA2_/MRDRNA2_34714_c0_seq2.p1 gnl/MRDRNA2_/MRDRNA2_34714_c0~~gnl/MRDRNA2_/MRDRNA2_34714_c0_seq2.p1  ORF type:complete len:116 (-),score=30.26 gnl/MRDRNA2_/MRDRNA2_34714_c0_seq2:81-428(-)